MKNKVIEQRVKRRISMIPWDQVDCEVCYIGGNSLRMAPPNDIDLFPVKGKDLKFGNDVNIVSSTRNAVTARLNGIPVQICKYEKGSLHELVESFDFAHIQIGAKLCKDIDGKMLVEEVYWTTEYEQAAIQEGTFYTGSDYPLSSLIRLVKYKERGDFAGKAYVWNLLNIVSDIIERGFRDYDDFKDQMDAVDLGLLPKDFQDADLMKIFDGLKHG